MPYAQTLLYANLALTTLGSNVGIGDTTIALATGQGALFPSPGAGQAFVGVMTPAGTTTDIPNEIVLVTSRSGDTLTVVRAQEGTSALAWSVGDNFGNLNTSGTMGQFAQVPYVQQQPGNWGSDTGTANAGAVALSPAPASLTLLIGAPITVLKAGGANTGGYTLNVNGLGPKGVTYQGGALVGGDLPAGKFFTVRYDGTVFELASPPGTARGGPPTGPAGGVLSGNYPNPGFENIPAKTVLGNDGSSSAAAAPLSLAADLFSTVAAGTVLANLTNGVAKPQFDTLLALAEAMGFATAVLANPGSISLPLIVGGNLVVGTLQWFQTGTLTFGAATTWTIPTPFPTACVFAIAGTQNPGSSTGNDAAGGVQIVSYNAGQVVVFCHNFSTGPTANINGLILAIGY